jgi:hypothetical protein
VLTPDCTVVWYGKLKIDSKSIPVIFDPSISPSIRGCIYLYNTERDQIVQYAWNIVQDLLVDVDKSEKSKIKKSFDSKWKAAKRKYTRGRDYSVRPSSQSPPQVSPAVLENRWDAAEGDGFELDDLA